MKKILMVLGILASLTSVAGEIKSTPTHQHAYLAGIAEFELGHLSAASELFYEAIGLAPTPEAAPAEYLPYLYYAVSSFEMGHTREARDALIQSQVYGVAANTETGQDFLGRYAADVMSASLDDTRFVIPAQVTVAASLSVSPDVEAASDSLAVAANSDESVFDANNDSFLRKSYMLKRCASATKQNPNDELPWFFHYQCGVELMKTGDAQGAIDSFLMGAKDLEDSRRGKRMYGMWFIDYLPYYQIALAHSKLGDWESASTAIQTSQSAGEFSPSDPDYETFTDLDRLIKSNLKSSDS